MIIRKLQNSKLLRTNTTRMPTWKIDDCSCNSWLWCGLCGCIAWNRANNTSWCYLVLRLAQTDFATWYSTSKSFTIFDYSIFISHSHKHNQGTLAHIAPAYWYSFRRASGHATVEAQTHFSLRKLAKALLNFQEQRVGKRE